jgi:hypothetical protein
VVSAETPTSIPTIRATTTDALARPWTPASVAARAAAFTGARARPKPNPPTTSGIVAGHPDSEVRSQRLIQTKDAAARAMPAAVIAPAAYLRVR